MNNRYTGDISGISEHMQFQEVKKKDGTPMTSFDDWNGLIEHIIDNTHRKDNREKIIENPILPNVLIGDGKGLKKKYERLAELEQQQNEINKKAGKKKKQIVLDKGRGKFIPARTGVIQLTLDPRNPKNKEAILKGQELTVSNLKATYGNDVLISFHYNETSAGCHFLKDGTVIEQDKAHINTKERAKYLDTKNNSNLLIDGFHKQNKDTLKGLAKEYRLDFVDGPVTDYSIKRKEKDFVKACQKIQKGEKLSGKDKRVLRKGCEENEIEISQKEVVKVFDEDKHKELMKKQEELLKHHLECGGVDLKKYDGCNFEQLIVNLVKDYSTERNETIKKYNKLYQKAVELSEQNKKKTITKTIEVSKKEDLDLIKQQTETINNLNKTVNSQLSEINKLNTGIKDNEKYVKLGIEYDDILKQQEEEKKKQRSGPTR